MRLTDEQVQKISEVFRARVTGACPFCGGRQFNLANELVMVNLYPVNPLSIVSDGAFPSIAVTCNTCGNIQTYNVHALGIAQIVGVPAPGRPLDNG